MSEGPKQLPAAVAGYRRFQAAVRHKAKPFEWFLVQNTGSFGKWLAGASGTALIVCSTIIVSSYTSFVADPAKCSVRAIAGFSIAAATRPTAALAAATVLGLVGGAMGKPSYVQRRSAWQQIVVWLALLLFVLGVGALVSAMPHLNASGLQQLATAEMKAAHCLPGEGGALATSAQLPP